MLDYVMLTVTPRWPADFRVGCHVVNPDQNLKFLIILEFTLSSSTIAFWWVVLTTKTSL